MENFVYEMAPECISRRCCVNRAGRLADGVFWSVSFPMSVFKRRRFLAEIVLLCVRRYCRYGISYRGTSRKCWTSAASRSTT
jgi:hypothetical protein